MELLIQFIAGMTILLVSPFFASKAMQLKQAGFGKSAIVGLITMGFLQILALFGGYLGPLSSILSPMLFVASWYQVVKIVYGTDTASTIVFMFWHMFFYFLMLSIFAMIIGIGSISWIWGG